MRYIKRHILLFKNVISTRTTTVVRCTRTPFFYFRRQSEDADETEVEEEVVEIEDESYMDSFLRSIGMT